MRNEVWPPWQQLFLHSFQFHCCQIFIYYQQQGWYRHHLTHWGRETHICIGNLFSTKLLCEPMLEYCHLDLWSILQWKFNRNSYIFIQEPTFENVVWKMAAILSQPHVLTKQSQFSTKPLFEAMLTYFNWAIRNIFKWNWNWHTTSYIQ